MFVRKRLLAVAGDCVGVLYCDERNGAGEAAYD